MFEVEPKIFSENRCLLESNLMPVVGLPQTLCSYGQVEWLAVVLRKA